MMKKPPYVENSERVELKDIIQLGDRLSLSRNEKQWIHELYIATSEEDDSLISVHDFIGDKTLSAARKRLNRMVEIGFMKKTSRRVPDIKRPVTIYKFRPFDYEAAEAITNSPYKQEFIPAYVEGDDSTLPSPYGFMRVDPKVDNLFCSVLFSALLFKSPRKDMVYPLQNWVNWYEKSVEVYTHCKSGRSIARVTDLRYFITIISMCASIIKGKLSRGEIPKNLFTLEASQINHQLERESDGGNTSAIYRALKRFVSTSFEIPSLPDEIVKKLGFDKGNIEIEMLTNLGRFQKETRSGRNVVVFTFSIPEILFQSIVGGNFNLFDINPELLRETNDVIFGLHLYGKRRLNYTTKPIVNNLRQLHEAIAPTLSYTDFFYKLHDGLIKRYEQMIKEFPQMAPDKDDEDQMITQEGNRKGSREILQGRINVYGIIISLRGNDAYLVNDPADRYVGALAKSKRINKAKTSGEKLGDIITEEMIQQRLDGL